MDFFQLLSIVTAVILGPFSYFRIQVEFISDEVWWWKCILGRCEKLEITPENKNSAMSLGVCKMFCNEFGKYTFIKKHLMLIV